jgi:hypothetical protein
LKILEKQSISRGTDDKEIVLEFSSKLRHVGVRDHHTTFSLSRFFAPCKLFTAPPPPASGPDEQDLKQTRNHAARWPGIVFPAACADSDQIRRVHALDYKYCSGWGNIGERPVADPTQ